LQLASEMKARGETGSIVTLLCDSGERYLDTYFNVNLNIGDLQPYAAKLEAFSQTGELA
ncbi:PLP-dependent cysteine synthase family protein, partial [Vibrio sp. 10N.222.45.F7]